MSRGVKRLCLALSAAWSVVTLAYLYVGSTTYAWSDPFEILKYFPYGIVSFWLAPIVMLWGVVIAGQWVWRGFRS